MNRAYRCRDEARNVERILIIHDGQATRTNTNITVYVTMCPN